MSSSYQGPLIVESDLLLKDDNDQEKGGVSKYFFILNGTRRSFGYRINQTKSYFRNVHKGRELLGFEANSTFNAACENEYGFKLKTYTRDYVLFAETKELYYKWIRLLNWMFNRIDIVHPDITIEQEQRDYDEDRVDDSNENYIQCGTIIEEHSEDYSDKHQKEKDKRGKDININEENNNCNNNSNNNSYDKLNNPYKKKIIYGTLSKEASENLSQFRDQSFSNYDYDIKCFVNDYQNHNPHNTTFSSNNSAKIPMENSLPLIPAIKESLGDYKEKFISFPKHGKTSKANQSEMEEEVKANEQKDPIYNYYNKETVDLLMKYYQQQELQNQQLELSDENEKIPTSTTPIDNGDFDNTNFYCNNLAHPFVSCNLKLNKIPPSKKAMKSSNDHFFQSYIFNSKGDNNITLQQRTQPKTKSPTKNRYKPQPHQSPINIFDMHHLHIKKSGTSSYPISIEGLNHGGSHIKHQKTYTVDNHYYNNKRKIINCSLNSKINNQGAKDAMEERKKVLSYQYQIPEQDQRLMELEQELLNQTTKEIISHKNNNEKETQISFRASKNDIIFNKKEETISSQMNNSTADMSIGNGIINDLHLKIEATFENNKKTMLQDSNHLSQNVYNHNQKMDFQIWDQLNDCFSHNTYEDNNISYNNRCVEMKFNQSQSEISPLSLNQSNNNNSHNSFLPSRIEDDWFNYGKDEYI